MYNNKPQIKIGDKWSYEEWGLLLGQGWFLESPKPKTILIDIPASDGVLDLTEALAGEPRYENRQLKFGLVFTQPESEWDAIRAKVDNYCNGQRMKIILPQDIDRHLMGRLNPTYLERGKGTATFDIEASCDPWRYKNNLTVVNITVQNNYFGVLYNERRRVIPEITTSASVHITINGVSHSMSPGTYKFTDFILNEGENPFSITSNVNAEVTITYQEAGF